MKKYELVQEGNLYRIIALRDFSNVEKGEKGGLVQSEDNLSHEGDCWVSDNAVISGNAQVSGNAWISGNARVKKAWVSGNAVISGNARVEDGARVHGDAWLTGEAVLAGNALATKKVITFGNAFCYKITVSDKHIRIGCKQFLKSEQKNFTDDEITKMDGEKALKFCRLFKPLAEQMNLFD